jgi:DNA-binding transcriptional LysR family regulator
MIVRRQFGPQETRSADDSLITQRLMVPALPRALVDQITRYANDNRMVVEAVETAPGGWQQLLEANPDTALLMPASALASHLGVTNIEVTLLDPPLNSAIVGRTDGNPIAKRFLERLKVAFDDNVPPQPFTPVLTRRRIRYFNLAYDLGRVSAAAKAANIAQPALSQQLQKLEKSLHARLFDRHSFGLVRTKTSRRFAPATSLLDKRLLELEIGAMSASLRAGGRLTLGILPSASHQGHLVARMTDAVLALRERHPGTNLVVYEAPNGVLQDWVLRGRVGLAIVEAPPTRMPRLSLDVSESLSVIVDPRYDPLPPGPVRLADLTELPLALPTPVFGLRQILDAAAQATGIDLRPLHEIEALTMLIALLSREPLATVLPPSAVRSELDAGKLNAHPIIQPTIHRRLYVIYSGDRSLTSIERDFVQLLRAGLADERSDAIPADHGALLDPTVPGALRSSVPSPPNTTSSVCGTCS